MSTRPRSPKATERQTVDIAALIAAQSPEAQEAIRACDTHCESMGRRSTEDVLDYGDLLTRIFTTVPADTYKTLVTKRYQITPRHATNLRRAAARFSPRREEMIRHTVHPAAMYELAAAPDDLVEAVLATYAAGDPMPVREIRALIKARVEGEGGEDKLEPLDAGGPRGLTALARIKADAEIKALVGEVKAILAFLEQRIEEAGGRRIVKARLKDGVVKPARLARRQLIELTRPIVVPDTWDGSSASFGHAQLPDSRWRDVEDLLFRLGGVDQWPGNLALTAWLVDEVLPVLRFVVDGTPFGEPTATLAARARDEAEAAEAETVDIADAPPLVEDLPEPAPKPRRRRRKAAETAEVLDETAPEASPAP